MPLGVYCPGERKTVQVQCPPRKICKKVWVAETKTKHHQLVFATSVKLSRKWSLHRLPHGA
ncbi:MAG: hypothetical protein R3B96_19705 [Pirellulaceae bacterium]